MHFLKGTTTSLAVLALAACGGSGGGSEDPVQGVDFEISDGVLADLEIPTDDQIAELPTQIADTVTTFIEANENQTLTPALPEGTALFVGPWAMGENDDGDALVGGTISLDVDFDTGDEFLSGRLDVEYVFDDDGNALTVTRTSPDEFDVNINGVITGGAISGNMAGQFDVDGETTTIGGFIDGQFTGEGATGALGTLQASVQYPDGGTGDFDGLFQANRETIGDF